MSQLAITFDYDALDRDTRALVETSRDRIKVLERKTGEAIIEIGRHLTAVKEALPHGQFMPWLDAEFGWTDRTARRFMDVAERFGSLDNGQIVQFAPSALTALASDNIPDELRNEFVERAESGERITHKAVTERLKAGQNLRVVDTDTGEIVGEIEAEELEPDTIPVPSSSQPTSTVWSRPAPSPSPTNLITARAGKEREQTEQLVASMPSESKQAYAGFLREISEPHVVAEALNGCAGHLMTAFRLLKGTSVEAVQQRLDDPEIIDLLNDITAQATAIFLVGKEMAGTSDQRKVRAIK